jgi:hypothetical protein
MQKLLWVTCVLAATACGGGGSVGIDDLPDELEGAQCDYLVACEGVEDRATCDASVIFDDMEFKSIQAGVDDGTIKYDSGKAGACADFIGGQNCEFTGFHEDSPCDDIFTGTVAPGGACMIGLQCAKRRVHPDGSGVRSRHRVLSGHLRWHVHRVRDRWAVRR